MDIFFLTPRRRPRPTLILDRINSRAI
jgi:hypothetical protein